MDNNQSKNQPLSRLEEAVLRALLYMGRHDLYIPAGNDNTPVKFVVKPGQKVEQIAEELVDKGLIKDAELFRKYLRFHELDYRLRAGKYKLNATMIIPEIAIKITESDSVVLKAILQ